jgi:hypothetical protein
MNDLAYAQLFRTEIENRLISGNVQNESDEQTRRNNFVTMNRIFHKA